ncbi:MAG: hypothetical protein ACREOC_16130 [Gemmatimonadales bacterium]
MLTRTSLSLGVAAVLALAACGDHQATGPTGDGNPTFGTGLPANPSTKEYKFNLIGVSGEKVPDMTGDNGKRMFVNLYGRSTIKLKEGPLTSSTPTPPTMTAGCSSSPIPTRMTTA